MDLLEAVVVKLVVGPEGGQGAHAHAVGKEYLERERVGTTLIRWARCRQRISRERESGHNSIQVGTL